MARPPLYTTPRGAVAVLGFAPGSLGTHEFRKSPNGSTTNAYKAFSRLLSAAGFTPSRGEMRRTYDSQAMVNWYTQNADRTFASMTASVGLDDLDDDDDDDVQAAQFTPPAISAPPQSTPVQGASIEDMIRAIAAQAVPVAPQIDENAVRAIVERELQNWSAPRAITVDLQVNDDEPPRDLGLQHFLFPKLLKMVSARNHEGNRLNIWIAGPAGSGKTRAAKNAADALGLSFASLGSIGSPYEVLGFVDARGETVQTLFREKFEHGGVILLDDFDGSDPNAVVASLQSATANGFCAFPDRVVQRHPDCVIIASANTYGNGATADYVGRLKQDGAFMSRFVQILWEYDEALETSLCSVPQWARRVQQMRANAAREGIKVIISPRATIEGAALLQAGLDQSFVEEATMRQGMRDADWRTVRGA